jgi:hypothetical protein
MHHHLCQLISYFLCHRLKEFQKKKTKLKENELDVGVHGNVP